MKLFGALGAMLYISQWMTQLHILVTIQKRKLVIFIIYTNHSKSMAPLKFALRQLNNFSFSTPSQKYTRELNIAVRKNYKI